MFILYKKVDISTLSHISCSFTEQVKILAVCVHGETTTRSVILQFYKQLKPSFTAKNLWCRKTPQERQ